MFAERLRRTCIPPSRSAGIIFRPGAFSAPALCLAQESRCSESFFPERHNARERGDASNEIFRVSTGVVYHGFVRLAFVNRNQAPNFRTPISSRLPKWFHARRYTLPGNYTHVSDSVRFDRVDFPEKYSPVDDTVRLLGSANPDRPNRGKVPHRFSSCKMRF